MEFNDLIIMIFLIWSRGASAKDAKSSCQAPQAYPGDAAKIVCSYNIDLSKEKRPFAVYRYPVNDTARRRDRVLDCFWPLDTLWCTTGQGYVFDKNVSDQFTLTILKASEEFVGRYECSTEPIRAQDKTSCNFALNLQTPSTAYSTSTSGRNTSIPPATTAGEGEENEDKNPTGAIVAGVIAGLALLIGGVIWYIRKGRADYILLLVGETGTGKSSLGNTLLETVVFETAAGVSVCTRNAQVGVTERQHRKIKVVDTPDISDNANFTDKQRKDQLSLWKRLAAPGPHAILLTVRCDVRYTAKQYEIYKQLKTLWGDSDSFCKLLIVAFTFGDHQDLESNQEQLSPASDEAKNVVKDANNRCVFFNDRAGPGEKSETASTHLDIADELSETTSETGPCAMLLCGTNQEQIPHASDEARNVLKDANGRHVVFSNWAEPGETTKTASTLLDKVDELSKTTPQTGRRFMSCCSARPIKNVYRMRPMRRKTC